VPAGDPPITYLDHAATTPVRREVVEAMACFGAGRFGNPSGSHRLAREARRALEEARDTVAGVMGARPDEVIFTSGGTESANLAVLGPLAARCRAGAPPRVLVCSAVEHAAVLQTCRAVAGGACRGQGVPALELRLAPVDRRGVLDLEALEAMLDPDVALVSVMTANNEVGTVQPVADVVAATRRLAPAAVVHTDAVQAAAYPDLAPAWEGADLVSVSAHKLGGPKGAGALVARAGVALDPIVHGGGQEAGRRSGTHDVAGAVGLAAALEAVSRTGREERARIGALRDRLAEGLRRGVPDVVVSGLGADVLAGHLHVRFAGIDQEELLFLLDEAGVCASGGAACASGALEPSHVMAAMGVDPAEARGAVRFSLGHTSTQDDVERALAAVVEAVARLRR
jgi:cysteine desulfurase